MCRQQIYGRAAKCGVSSMGNVKYLLTLEENLSLLKLQTDLGVSSIELKQLSMFFREEHQCCFL